MWNHNRRPGGRSLSHVRIFVVDQCKLAAPLFKRHLKRVDGIPASSDRLRQRLTGQLVAGWGRRSRTSQAAFGDTQKSCERRRSLDAEILWMHPLVFSSRWLRIAADPKAAALLPLPFPLCCALVSTAVCDPVSQQRQPLRTLIRFIPKFSLIRRKRGECFGFYFAPPSPPPPSFADLINGQSAAAECTVCQPPLRLGGSPSF